MGQCSDSVPGNDDWFDQDEYDIADAIRLYEYNKKVAVGALIVCPVCAKKVRKVSQRQAFCGLKAVGSSTCRDQFHNICNPSRRERAQRFM